MTIIPERVGFVGPGLMGEPRALRLARPGLPLVDWNRTSAKVLGNDVTNALSTVRRSAVRLTARPKMRPTTRLSLEIQIPSTSFWLAATVVIREHITKL